LIWIQYANSRKEIRKTENRKEPEQKKGRKPVTGPCPGPKARQQPSTGQPTRAPPFPSYSFISLSPLTGGPHLSGSSSTSGHYSSLVTEPRQSKRPLDFAQVIGHQATAIRSPYSPPPSPFPPSAQNTAKRMLLLVGDRGLCELVRPIPPSPVSPSPPPLPYPICHDLAHLLIHLLCSNLQPIEHGVTSPKLTDARPSPAAPSSFAWKQSKSSTTLPSFPRRSDPRGGLAVVWKPL
jgi:hypothetical protein